MNEPLGSHNLSLNWITHDLKANYTGRSDVMVHGVTEKLDKVGTEGGEQKLKPLLNQKKILKTYNFYIYI